MGGCLEGCFPSRPSIRDETPAPAKRHAEPLLAVAKVPNSPTPQEPDKAAQEAPEVKKTGDAPKIAVSQEEVLPQEEVPPPREWLRARTIPKELLTKAIPYPRHKLSNIDERRVLKKGLHQIFKAFVTAAAGTNITEIPRRVMQGSASTLRRLLSKEREFLQCPKGEVSDAQRDIRHLSLEQLLAIRMGTLEFQSQSDSHACHMGFLEIVDKHMYEKIVRRMLRIEEPPAFEESPKGKREGKSEEAWLIALGRSVALTLGAAQVLREEGHWDEMGDTPPGKLQLSSDAEGQLHLDYKVSKCEDRAEDRPLCVPKIWALALDAKNWEGCSSEGECWMALLHTQELWLQPLGGDPPAIGDSIRNLAVIQETKSAPLGPGERKLLQWTIYVLRPRKDDAPMLLQLIDEPNRAKSALAKELTATMEKRSGISSKKQQLSRTNELRNEAMDELSVALASRRGEPTSS